MDELLVDQAILIEAITEVAELFALMKILGMDASQAEAEVKRLTRRLGALNRKIEDGLL